MTPLSLQLRMRKLGEILHLKSKRYMYSYINKRPLVSLVNQVLYMLMYNLDI